MDEFKAWLWETFLEVLTSVIAVAVVVGTLWGFILIIKWLA
jgi:hypothetical protein